MYVEVSRIENALLYMAKGKGLRWIPHLDYGVDGSLKLDTRKGW
jgi:hypothetical protein